LDLLKRQKSGKQGGLYLLNWMFEDVMMDGSSCFFGKAQITSIAFPDGCGLQ